MKRFISVLSAVLLSLGMLFVASGVATAQDKVVVTPGLKLDVGRDGYVCTTGVVGTDSQGNYVGISAGHCLGLGTDVYYPGKRNLGPIGETVRSSGGPDFLNTGLDYSVILYDKSKVVLDSDGPGIRVDGNAGTVGLGAFVCKSGITTGRQCGYVTGRDQLGNVIAYVLTGPGDSGGPLAAGTKWLGITSKVNFNIRGPFAFTAADKIRADLNVAGGVGAGFVPVNQ